MDTTTTITQWNPAAPQPRQMSHDEWTAEAIRRFGNDPGNWRFQCPICDRVYSVGEFADAGGGAHQAAQACIGRVNGKGYHAFFGQSREGTDGCDFASYGLFSSDFIVVKNTIPIHVMPFAPMTQSEGGQRA